MQDRILWIVNGLLVVLCVGFIVYLATEKYVEPEEVRQAQAWMENETKSGKDVPLPAMNTGGPRDYVAMSSKNVLQPLYTPTPTPTPSPTPTPAPADLATAVYAWQVQELAPDKATFVDQRSQEVFDMTVGGPPKESVDNSGRPVQVKLVSVDLNAFKAVLGYENQTQEKAFQ